MMNAIQKFKSIRQGWQNVVFLSPEVEKVAEARAKICSSCPHAVEDSFMQAIGKLLKRVTGVKCNLCGCPISAKTRSMAEECPDPAGAKW